MIDRETPQTALEAYLEARVEALEEALRIARGKTDTATVMKVLLNALEEEGFIIKDADEKLGVIMATKETENPRRLRPRSTVFQLSAVPR